MKIIDSCMLDTTRDTIRSFLDLPHGALPSAQWVRGPAAESWLGTPWNWLRDYDRDDIGEYMMGEEIILRADRPEWRDGVIVTV